MSCGFVACLLICYLCWFGLVVWFVVCFCLRVCFDVGLCCGVCLLGLLCCLFALLLTCIWLPFVRVFALCFVDLVWFLVWLRLIYLRLDVC